MISSQRLADNLAAMAKISASSEGITRLAFSDSDWQGRDFLIRQMQEAGLAIRTDAFGNVIGRREGRQPGLPAVMFGSHADSVPNGGNYDGIVGILCAIETVRSLAEDGWQGDHPLEVVLFMAEESSRFGTATLGSKAMRGELTPGDLHMLKDKDAISLHEALELRGLDAAAIATAEYKAPLKAFFEVHIEQGKVLEHAEKPIGIVTGIAAPTRLRVVLHGQADHSGATPMNLRHDALCAAAEIILAVEKFAAAEKEPQAVGTIGVIAAQPGAMNVIPGRVELGIDIRSIAAETKDRVAASVLAAIGDICRSRGLDFESTTIADEKPAPIRPEVIDFFEQLCQEKEIPCLKLPSGAGHDAMHWTEYAPTGMLFLPCRDGISHNPAESASLGDIATAAMLLQEAVKKTAAADFHWQ